MSEQLKLVIFDCDGTLVDSQHVIIGAMRSAFTAYDLPPPDDRDIRRIIGLSLENAVSALAPNCREPLLGRLIEAYKQAFIAQRQRADFYEPLFSGARQSLEELTRQSNVLLGVATGKSRRGVDVLFERENLGGYFTSIQTADDAPSKPHPGMIENALAETGVSPAAAMMIGDTSFDMEMARNAGIAAIGVTWGYHDNDHLQQSGAHRLIDSFEEIPGLVNEFEKQ